MIECIPEIKHLLFSQLDPRFNVFDEQGSLRYDLFEAMLRRHGYEWPRHADGRLDLRDTTFRDMVLRYPALELVREIRRVTKHLNLSKLQVGHDRRNRTLLTPFSTRTSRNAPSGNKYIFGLPSWLRRLIVPRPGTALLYVDVASQEFGLGAYLSGDPHMIASYESGDPYLHFAKLANAVPECATAKTHPRARALYKQCCLAVGYGMGEHSLALRIGLPVQYARSLIDQHKQLYRRYWKWTHAAIAQGRFFGHLQTVFGWTLHVREATKDRTIRNFPLQGNASEQLRLAVIYAVENGIRVVGTLHDALLVECPIHDVEAIAVQTQNALAMASEDVLGEHRLRADVKVILPPNHFVGDTPNEIWDIICGVLEGHGYTDRGQKSIAHR
jgi:DNA polymerase-1